MNEELSTLQRFFVDYDVESDSLLFRFDSPQEGGTGIQLSDDVVVYIDFDARRATALLLLNFRRRGGARTKFKIESALSQLTPQEKQVLLPLLRGFPLRFFLRVPTRQHDVEVVRPTQDQLMELVHAR